MSNKQDWVNSVRVQLYTNDEKKYLQFKIYTNKDDYKFGTMCDFLNHACASEHLSLLITDYDDCLTKDKKEQISFNEQDFVNKDVKDIKSIANKYWKENMFQFYVGDDFHAYKKILPYFSKVVDAIQTKPKEVVREQ